MVDAIDRLRDRICGAQGMRDDVLLYEMAHVLINGGTAAGGAPPTESIREVTEGLSSELLDFALSMTARYPRRSNAERECGM